MAPTRTLVKNAQAHHPHNGSRLKKRADDIYTTNALYQGWHLKPHYKDSLVPEFSRPPKTAIDRPINPRPPALTLDAVEALKTLGQGNNGQVLLARTRRKEHPLDKPGSLFALKAVRKKDLRRVDLSGFISDIKRKNVERSRLADLPWNPFVNGVIQSFYDDKNLYLMLELTPNGTLRNLITKRAPFDPLTTAFYFANIVCGLDFLEDNGVVHRDLKPENILLGPDGYLCIADFGEAAIYLEESDWATVGTPSYMAPEVVSQIGQTEDYSLAVDWWAAGCILFEMVTRTYAYGGATQQAIYRKVLSEDLKWPPEIQVGKILKSLILSLLTKDSGRRLGFNGTEEVQDHPWFSNVDWGQMVDRKYIAPFVPPPRFLVEKWHTAALPSQHRLPDLKVVEPPLHLKYDNRFPEKPVLP